MDVKKKLQTLALTVAGVAAVAVAQAQPAPAPSAAPSAPPPAPAPTTTADPNAPPPAPAPSTDPNAPPPAPTTTATAQPAPPPPGTPPAQDPNAPPAQDPNAPPAPPPVAQPQPAPQPQPPPVVPSPQPQQPAPAPEPAPAKPEKTATQKFLSKFAGTIFAWTHQATVSAFGIPSAENPYDGNGLVYDDGDYYAQTLTFVPGMFLYRDDRHNVRASTLIAPTVELTNCDSCTYRYQWDVNNIPIRVSDTIAIAAWGAGGGATAAAIARDPTLASAAEYRLQAIVLGSAILPTSRTFASGGLLFGTSLSLGLRQQVKLFGSASPYLPNVTVTLSEAWTHQFWRATSPIADNIEQKRQDFTGNSLIDNQLRGAANVENRLATTLNVQLPIYGDLQFNAQYTHINDFPYAFQGDPTNSNGCDVKILSDCVDLGHSESKMRVITSFDLSLYYQFTNEIAADIGYNNFALQLHPGGYWRNPVFSPSSAFYADIYVFPEAILQRLIAPSKPKTQVGRR